MIGRYMVAVIINNGNCNSILAFISFAKEINASMELQFPLFIITATIYLPIIKASTFKSGAQHLLGIEYSDEQGRVSFVQQNENCKIWIPFCSQNQAPDFNGVYQWINLINTTIN